MADLLTEEGHYDADSIAEKRDEILDRYICKKSNS